MRPSSMDWARASLIEAAVCMLTLINNSAYAQTVQGPASPGLSFFEVKNFVDPVSSGIAEIVYSGALVWEYLMSHSAAAGLFAAFVAGLIAVVSIKSNASTTRLRETFSTINSANWNQDVVKARQVFSSLKQSYVANPQGIAAFCYDLQNREGKAPDEIARHEELAGLLRTILNDYENQALGIKLGILDELYSYRYLRGNVLRDWKALSPLVTAYRHRFDSNLIYIEFEGLTHAWEHNRSYKTGRKLRNARKHMRFG